jgi:osmoprotectant transport system substrate-binding protein
VMLTLAIAAVSGVGLLGCSSSDPVAAEKTGAASTKTSALVVGSQAYYSNEIVAEIYAQALEREGFQVDRQFQIGQREVYLPEITSGKIDVFPEYIGSLLQAFDKNATSGTVDTVYNLLKTSAPEGLTILKPSPASDQNSWTVTRAFAKEHKLTDLASLKNISTPIVVGGNSELEVRPYGPKALAAKYGVNIGKFRAVEDSGGPLTVKALVDGDIQLANIYTADPNIAANDLVALEDPDGLFLPDNIAPVVSMRVDAKARGILTKVSAALLQADFVKLNAQSINDKKSAKSIATDWLAKRKL